MAAHTQNFLELYDTLSLDEKSVVYDIICGREECKRKKKFSKDDDSVTECSSFASKSLHGSSSRTRSCIEELEVVQDQDEDELQTNKEYSHHQEEKPRIPKPQLISQDYEAFTERLKDLPNESLLETDDDFDCEDPKAFELFALEAAAERLGLCIEQVEGLETCNNKPNKSSTMADDDEEFKNDHTTRFNILRRVGSNRRGQQQSASFHMVQLLGRIRQKREASRRDDEKAVWSLYQATRSPEVATQFAYHFGVPVLLNIMQAHARNAMLQQHALGILINTCQTSVDYILTHKTVFPVLVNIATEYSYCSIMLESVFKLWLHLVRVEDVDAIKYMVTKVKSTVPTILNLMRAHETNSRLVYYGFSILNVLNKHQCEVRTIAASSEYLAALVYITKAQEDNLLIHREAFKLLRSLQVVSAEEFDLPSWVYGEPGFARVLSRAGLMSMVKSSLKR